MFLVQIPINGNVVLSLLYIVFVLQDRVFNDVLVLPMQTRGHYLHGMQQTPFCFCASWRIFYQGSLQSATVFEKLFAILVLREVVFGFFQRVGERNNKVWTFLWLLRSLSRIVETVFCDRVSTVCETRGICQFLEVVVDCVYFSLEVLIVIDANNQLKG